MSPTVPPTSTITTSAPVCLRSPHDALLDLVGDVRDDLDGAAEEVAAPLARDHGRVDLPGGDVVSTREAEVDEALVVAEVEVGLGAVVGDEDLAVLVGVHRARIDVDVRVELDDGDGDPAALEQTAERGDGDALADRRNDSAADEDVLGQTQPPLPQSKV